MQSFRFRSSSVAMAFEVFLKNETGATPSIDVSEERSNTTIPAKIWTVRIRDFQLSEEQLDRCSRTLSRLNAERSDYLERRAAQYGKLDPATLEAIWAKRASLDTDELDVVRVIVRNSKGIVAGPSGCALRVCPKCGMVEDNCTCGRTWF